MILRMNLLQEVCLLIFFVFVYFMEVSLFCLEMNTLNKTVFIIMIYLCLKMMLFRKKIQIIYLKTLNFFLLFLKDDQ